MIEKLKEVEKHIFEAINTVFNGLGESEFVYVVGDSTAVRAYTPFKRDIDDIDIIFPSSTNIQELQKFVFNKFPGCELKPLKSITEDGLAGHFLRTKIEMDVKYHEAYYFTVDYHVGGSVFKEIFGCKVDDTFFIKREFRNITSFGTEEIRIPVPKMEEVLLFKLTKYLGHDKLDILSLLTSDSIDFNYIKSRSDFYNKEKIKNGLASILLDKDALFAQWETWHFMKFPTDKKSIVIHNLEQIKKHL